MTANKKKHTALKTVRNILLILFAVCVIAAGAVTLRGYHMYTCALERLPVLKAARTRGSTEGWHF